EVVARAFEIVDEFGGHAVNLELDQVAGRNIGKSGGADVLDERQRQAVNPHFDQLASGRVQARVANAAREVERDAHEEHIVNIISAREIVAEIVQLGDEARIRP